MEAGHYCGHAVDQLETEPEIDQHAEHGPENGSRGLRLQLVPDGGAHAIHLDAGIVE